MTSFDGNVDRVILALANNLFIPGTPFLYYGNEIGMKDGNFAGDKKFRTDMDWKSAEIQEKDTKSILNRTKELIKIRNDYKALNNGELITLDSNDKQVFAFVRKLDKENILVIFNYKDRETDNIEINLTPLGIDSAKLKVIFGSKLNDMTKENKANFKLNKISPFSFALYSIEE